MASSLIYLILSALTVVGFVFTVSDRLRARRERAQAKDASEIKKAVDDAVAKQVDADDDKIRAAEAANAALQQQLVERTAALQQQLVERTDELRQARRDVEFYRAQLFARLGGAIPEPPSASENP